MTFSSQLIETVAQCDTLIQETNNEYSNLQFRKANIEVQITNSTSTVNLVPPQLANLTAQLTVKENMLTSATDPETIRNLQIEIHNLTSRKLRLEGQVEATDRLRLLDREFAIAKVTKQLEAYDEFLAALNARKAALMAAAQ
jgi:predicted  nucleic acid-binding Zn-ribbon protein